MSISLTGLLIIQFVWIRNAILIKASEFDEKIQVSLDRIVEKTGFKQKADYIFNLSSNDSLDNFTAEIKVKYGDADSNIEVRREIVRKPIKSKKQQQVVWSLNEENKDVHVFQHDNQDVHVQELIVKGKEPSGEVVLVTDSTTEIVYIEELASKVEEQTRKFEHTFRKLALEYIVDTIAPEKLVNPKELGGLIEDEFRNANIKGNYNWSVVKPEKDNAVLISVKENTLPKKAKTYSVNLFPDKVYATSMLLEVDIENSFWQSLGYMSGIHITSLLFSLVIILTYIFTFNLLLKQKKISEMKSDFINNMTHEFKTPIATINLAADSIINSGTLKSEEKIKHFTGIIKDENLRMNQQVEKVLQMSTLENHELLLQPDVVSLHDIVRTVVKSFNLIIQKRNGKIKLTLKAEKDEIFADFEHLKNIINNLVDNAIKYTLEEPVIEIDTELSDNQIILSVKDNGIGISKKDKDLVFERFFRVHTGDVHDIKGFGVGLNYVKEVVGQMGGNVQLISETGKGSVFVISFKLIDD